MTDYTAWLYVTYIYIYIYAHTHELSYISLKIELEQRKNVIYLNKHVTAYLDICINKYIYIYINYPILVSR